MRVFADKKTLKKALKQYKTTTTSIGLVPTMGALHQGHLSLVQKAIKNNTVVVVSIFVNPTQFDKAEDLEKYPSDLENDIKLLNSLSANIIVFTPTKKEIYDGEIIAKKFNFNGLEKVMEGAFRTGHFDGVATIVELLFKAVEPDEAYFGEKDFQQLQIIKSLVQQSQLDIKIIACSIARESNGLARSSRNERLTKTTRKEAGVIYDTLKTAKKKFGTENVTVIKEWVQRQFIENQLFELEYFEITDVTTLTPTTKVHLNRKYRAFIAVYADNVRLIDNIALN